MKPAFLLILFFCNFHAIGQDFPEMVTIPIVKAESKGFNPLAKFFNKSKNQPEEIKLVPFAISKTEVTVRQFKVFCKETNVELPSQPSYYTNDDFPVSNVSVYDALAYVNWLTEKKGGIYRIPNYEEWLFAFAGGLSGKDFDYSGSKNLDDVGWYRDNASDRIQEVATKKGNELGLFDMSGNLSEICLKTDSEKRFKFVLIGGDISSTSQECTAMDPTTIQMSEKKRLVGFRVASSN